MDKSAEDYLIQIKEVIDSALQRKVEKYEVIVSLINEWIENN